MSGRRLIAILFYLACALLTSWTLAHQFGTGAVADVWHGLTGHSAARPLAALALTTLSFAALASYDWLGARVVAPGRVPARLAFFTGATANAVSNTLGFHVVTGSLVRARMYLRRGLTRAEAARIVSLSWLATGLGFVTMTVLAEAAAASHPGSSRSAWGAAVAAGMLLLLLLLFWLSRAPRELALFRFRLPLPSSRLAAAQMAIGAVETAAAVGALYVLLPADLAPPFVQFALECVAAVLLGLLAHAPGGVGVFEASITALLGGAGRSDLLGALLLYRAIYNLLPFAVSLVALAWVEWRAARGQFDRG
ncbi:MAG: lysylphosphatidylglycerol synthase domain-containing protein [Ramlibacter sp.]